MSAISLTISLISLLISIFTFWKTFLDEQFNQHTTILSVTSPEELVSSKAGIIYVEGITMNNSSLPLALIDAHLEASLINPVGFVINSTALHIDSLISTHTEKTGSTITRKIEDKSNAMPLIIPPKSAKYFILAFPSPGVLGIQPNNVTKINLKIDTNRKKYGEKCLINIATDELKPKVKPLLQFLKERARL